MEKNRKVQIIAIVALVVGVVGLSIGFAAFSSVLTIQTSATVTPDSSTMNVDFSSTEDKVEVAEIIPTSTPDSLVTSNGVIDNSAIAGYYLAGEQGKIYGYRNSTVYIGGLVGYNSANGSITNSAADLPKLSIDMNTATAYAGSFVGYNDGIIDNTYGISLIESKAPDGDTKIAGFAGYNTGTINNSYCATSLISSGNGSKTYNFAPNFGGGTVNNSYYLHGGSFNYIDK